MPSDTHVVPFRAGSVGHAAHSYTARNILILPCWWTLDGVCQCARGPRCNKPGKHPLTRHGVDDATTNPDRITEYWLRWPRANIGLAAHANGLAIIDVDPQHGGDDTIRQLAHWADTVHGIDLYATRLIRTGSGGTHLYYHAPPGGIKTCARTFHHPAHPDAGGMPGVDTRGVGGYVIAPPSVHACGGRYQTIRTGSRVAPWPWPLTPLTTHPQPTTGGQQPPSKPAPTARRGGAVERRPGEDSTLYRLRCWAANGYQLELTRLAGLPAPQEGWAKNDALARAAYRLGLKLDAGLLDSRTQIENDLLRIARRWTGHAQTGSMRTIQGGLDKSRGRAHTLALPPWANGYTITPRGNR